MKTVFSIRAPVFTVLKRRTSAGGTGAPFLLNDDNYLPRIIRNEQKGAI
jgi:hypothetical protein